MKETFKRILKPLRKLSSRFIEIPDTSVFYCAANIVCTDRVEGDFLEFGVFGGDSFRKAYRALEAAFEGSQAVGPQRTAEDAEEVTRIWKNLRFFAFDSFQGLPELEGCDKQGKDFARGQYACAQDKFHVNLAKAAVPLDKVVTVPGWFQDTCTEETKRKFGMKKACIVHVDCDLYASTKTVLNFVKPMLTDGTIIVFDDWFCFRGNPNLGEQRAFNEWKANMPDWIFTEYRKEGPWINSFIASKRNVT